MEISGYRFTYSFSIDYSTYVFYQRNIKGFIFRFTDNNKLDVIFAFTYNMELTTSVKISQNYQKET